MWCQPVLPSAGADLDVADVDVGGPFADGLLEVEGGKVSYEKNGPWLFRDEILSSYVGDYFINHFEDP